MLLLFSRGDFLQEVQCQYVLYLLQALLRVLLRVTVRDVRGPAHRECREEAVQVLQRVDRLAGQHDVLAFGRLRFLSSGGHADFALRCLGDAALRLLTGE